MIVTSLTELAASVRSTLTLGSSNTAAASSNPTPAPARETDTVELSASRAETLITALDKDGDGLVSKEEFAEGAIELLKRASVRFHHQHAGSGKSIEKRDDRWTSRLEDVFAHVDENHDGEIELTELTSALPKPAQRPEQRQSCSSTQTSTGSPTTVTATASVTVVAVAIRRYVTS